MALPNEHLGSCWVAIGHGAICHSRCQPPPMSHGIGKGCGLGLGGQGYRQDEEGVATLQVKRRAGPSPQGRRRSGVWRRCCLPCSCPSFKSPLSGPPSVHSVENSLLLHLPGSPPSHPASSHSSPPEIPPDS